MFPGYHSAIELPWWRPLCEMYIDRLGYLEVLHHVLLSAPWKEGRCATWESSPSPTPLQPHICWTRHPLALAQQLKQRPRGKKTNTPKFLPPTIFSAPFWDLWSHKLCRFWFCVCQRLSLISDDLRETSFVFQHLSVSIQRFNSVSTTHLGICQHNFWSAETHLEFCSF